MWKIHEKSSQIIKKWTFWWVHSLRWKNNDSSSLDSYSNKFFKPNILVNWKHFKIFDSDEQEKWKRKKQYLQSGIIMENQKRRWICYDHKENPRNNSKILSKVSFIYENWHNQENKWITCRCLDWTSWWKYKHASLIFHSWRLIC